MYTQEPGRTGSKGDGDGDGESWECRCQDAGTPRHTEDDGPELVSITQHCITASFAQVVAMLHSRKCFANVYKRFSSSYTEVAEKLSALPAEILS
jgi:hypothetical protein